MALSLKRDTWISSGYIPPVNSHKSCSIDISQYYNDNYICNTKNDQKPCCGSYSVERDTNVLTANFYYWKSTRELIEITEYAFISDSTSKFTLYINGSYLFGENIYLKKIGNYLYIIFSVSQALVVLSIKILNKESANPILDNLKEKYLNQLPVKVFKFKIINARFFGIFTTSSTFYCCVEQTENSYQLYEIELPINNEPISCGQISTRYRSVNSFSEILKIIPFSYLNTFIVHAHILPSIDKIEYIFVLLSNGSIMILSTNDRVLVSKSLVKELTNSSCSESLIISLDSNTCSKMYAEGCYSIALSVISNHFNFMFAFLFSVEKSSSIVHFRKLNAAKLSNQLSNFLNLAIYNDYIFVTYTLSDESGIHVCYTPLTNDQNIDTPPWLSISNLPSEKHISGCHFIPISSSHSFQQSEYFFNKSFSSEISNTALYRCCKSYDCFQDIDSEEGNLPQLDFNQKNFIEAFDKIQMDISKSQMEASNNGSYQDEYSFSFYNELIRYDRFIENSTDCACFEFNDKLNLLLLITPSTGVKVILPYFEPDSYLELHSTNILAKNNHKFAQLNHDLYCLLKWNKVGVINTVLVAENIKAFFTNLQYYMFSANSPELNNTFYQWDIVRGIMDIEIDGAYISKIVQIGEVLSAETDMEAFLYYFLRDLIPPFHDVLVPSYCSSSELDLTLSKPYSNNLFSHILANMLSEISSCRIYLLLSLMQSLIAVRKATYDCLILQTSVNFINFDTLITHIINNGIIPILSFYTMIKKLHCTSVASEAESFPSLLSLIITEIIHKNLVKSIEISVIIDSLFSFLLYNPDWMGFLLTHSQSDAFELCYSILDDFFFRMSFFPDNFFPSFMRKIERVNLLFYRASFYAIKSDVQHNIKTFTDLFLGLVPRVISPMNFPTTGSIFLDPSSFIINLFTTSCYFAETQEDYNNLVVPFTDLVQNSAFVYNGNSLVHYIMFINFEYKVKKGLYDDAISILITSQGKNPYYEESIKSIILILLKDAKYDILIRLNYLTLQVDVYNMLLDMVTNCTEYIAFIELYDIIIDFNIYRSFYKKAAITAYTVYRRLLPFIYSCKPAQKSYFLQHIQKYLLISSFSLSRISHPKYRQFFVKIDEKPTPSLLLLQPKLDIVKIDDINKILAIIRVFKIILKYDIDQTYSCLECTEFKNAVNILCKIQCYEIAIQFCYQVSRDLLEIVFEKMFLSCLMHQKYNIDDFQHTDFFKRNSISHIHQSYGNYDVWKWFEENAKSCFNSNSNLYCICATSFLQYRMPLPRWLYDTVVIKFPNQLILIYLIYDYYIEAATIMINLLDTFLQYDFTNDEKNMYISYNTLDQVSIHMNDQITKLQKSLTTQNQISELTKLLLIQTHFQETLKKYQNAVHNKAKIVV